LYRKIYFYFAEVVAGFGGRGTDVCFSTWLAVAHSASLAGMFSIFAIVLIQTPTAPTVHRKMILARRSSQRANRKSSA